MANKSPSSINYDFALAALQELNTQKDVNHTFHYLCNYLYTIFAPQHINIYNPNEALQKLYTYPGIEKEQVRQGMILFLARYYTSVAIANQTEMDLLAPYFKDLMVHNNFKEIVRYNKDSTFFNEHYKKEKALLSDSASTQDVLDLLEKMTRFKDLELPIKILAAFHSQTKGENQSINLAEITASLIEKVMPSTIRYRNVFRDPDSAGKLYRLLELGQIPVEKIDAAYFGIISNRPVYSKTSHYNSYVYATSGVDSAHARKSLIALTHFWADKLFNNFYNPEQIKELIKKVFDYEHASNPNIKPQDLEKETTRTMIRNLVGFVQSQKTDLKTLSIVCPHIKTYFEEEKAKGNFITLNSPQNSSSSDKSVGDVGVYWVLNFISNNATKIKEVTGETAENILKALIKIENQKLSKSMAKVKEIPTDKPKHNKI